MALLPDEPIEEEKLEQLPEDGQTPFRPADDVASDPPAQDPVRRADSTDGFDDTHPSTDTNVQPEEQYEEGIAGASEAPKPPPGIPHIADADHS